MTKPDDFSCPILIFGDPFLSKNFLIATKKQNPSSAWIHMSASSDSLDEIRMEAGISGWGDSSKIIVIQDLPNKKQVRDFLLNVASFRNDGIKIIIWDSKACIKVNPKTKVIDKTWGDFIKKFKGIKDSKVINYGEELTEKKVDASIDFVKKIFLKNKKEISSNNAKLLIEIVGLDRGMILSDIEKMSITAPETITKEFILENAFPSSSEALVYKLTNLINEADYESSIYMMERLLDSGTNANQLAEAFLRKARWQLSACHLWFSGMSWSSIPNKLTSMGKFPSYIWHKKGISDPQKNKEAEQYKSPEDMIRYLVETKTIPKKYFKSNKAKKDKAKAERLSYLFWAEQEVDFIKNKIVGKKPSDDPTVKSKVLSRAIAVYIFINDKLSEIRYGKNTYQDLQEMLRAMTNLDISRY